MDAKLNFVYAVIVVSVSASHSQSRIDSFAIFLMTLEGVFMETEIQEKESESIKR